MGFNERDSEAAGEQMEYQKFLEERRKLMAVVIRDAFEKLK